MSPSAPDLLPVLSAGKHRSPRKGACFMELASYLAGERWSDSPRCTHSLLASAARCVNDCTSDSARHRLAPLIPEVIGTSSDDLRVDGRIALVSAIHALPVAAERTQRVLAVGVLSCESMLAHLEGRPETLSPRSAEALAYAPKAAEWARNFCRPLAPSPRAFRRTAAPSIVHAAVVGIARACVDDRDERLRALLVDAIAECRALTCPPQPSVDSERWAYACALTR